MRPRRSLVSSEVGYRDEYINNTTVNLVRRGKVNKVDKRIKGKKATKKQAIFTLFSLGRGAERPPLLWFFAH